MANSLCSLGLQNTGDLSCGPSRGILKKLSIFNGVLDATDYADEATLFNNLVTNSKLSKKDPNKVFILQEAQDIVDNSGANKEGTLGLGFKTTLLEGLPSYTIKIFASADELKRLRAMNNKTVRVFEHDANGLQWGTKSGANYKGFQAKLFFSGNRLATGQNVEEGVVVVTISILSVSEYLDNAYYANLSAFNIEDIKGLLDAQLRKISNASNVYKIAVEILGSNIVGPYNLYDDYSTLLAALTFTAGTGANYGTSLAITSVALDSTLKALTVTFDSTAYTALAAGTKIQLSGPTPATLDTADITGIEMLPVIVVR